MCEGVKNERIKEKGLGAWEDPVTVQSLGLGFYCAKGSTSPLKPCVNYSDIHKQKEPKECYWKFNIDKFSEICFFS